MLRKSGAHSLAIMQSLESTIGNSKRHTVEEVMYNVPIKNSAITMSVFIHQVN